MLRKLIKYDLKATARTFTPVYLVVLALAALTVVFNNLAKSIFTDDSLNLAVGFGILFTVLYGIAMLVLPFLTVIFCMRHFYDNLFKDEGYLMHTLPVTPAKLIWSKVITGSIWLLVTTVVAVISGGILLAGTNGMEVFNVGKIFTYLTGASPQDIAENVLVTILGIVVVLAQLVCFLLMLYAALSIGSLVPKHHRGVTVLVIIGFFVAEAALLFALGLGFANAAENGFLDPLARTIGPMLENLWPAVWITFGCIMAYLSVLCVLYFFITHFIMKRRLNLQ